MPKISAPTVIEHVAHQEAAVLDAAIALFVRHGYDHVTMAEIAAKVGLARNSLYRYFPDKAHIMVRWFRTELPIQVAVAADALSGDAPTAVRLRRYVDAQLDYAATPAHGLIASLVGVVPTVGEQIRLEFMASHRDLLAPLDAALRRAGLTNATDRSIVADLIGGLINAGADRETRIGRDEMARARIAGAIEQLISPSEPGARGSAQSPSTPVRKG
jgi:AcrR family transcriptional regulator